MNLGSVYVRFGKDYDEYGYFNNFGMLLRAVAESAAEQAKIKLLQQQKDDWQVCESNTIGYITNKANEFISNIPRAVDIANTTHMALFSSKKQIRRLIGVCNHKDRRLSCYSLVVLHIIYEEIKQNKREEYMELLDALAALIHDLANQILNETPSALVQYIVDSCDPVEREFNGEGRCRPEDFPEILRRF